MCQIRTSISDYLHIFWEIKSFTARIIVQKCNKAKKFVFHIEIDRFMKCPFKRNHYFWSEKKKPKSSLALTRELVRMWRIKGSFSPVPLCPVPFCPIPLCPEGKLFALIYLQIIICPKIICLEIRNSHR